MNSNDNFATCKPVWHRLVIVFCMLCWGLPLVGAGHALAQVDRRGLSSSVAKQAGIETSQSLVPWRELIADALRRGDEPQALSIYQVWSVSDDQMGAADVERYAMLLDAYGTPLRAAAGLEAAVDAGRIDEDASALRTAAGYARRAREPELVLELLERTSALTGLRSDYLAAAGMAFEYRRFDRAVAALEAGFQSSPVQPDGEFWLLLGMAYYFVELDAAGRSRPAPERAVAAFDRAACFPESASDARVWLRFLGRPGRHPRAGHDREQIRIDQCRLTIAAERRTHEAGSGRAGEDLRHRLPDAALELGCDQYFNAQGEQIRFSRREQAFELSINARCEVLGVSAR